MGMELLAPAGDMERLRMAVTYGADAVYLAGNDFGMRAFAGNFDRKGLREAVALCHGNGVSVHVTCNTMPRCGEVDRLREWLEYLDAAGVDAAIVADLGVFRLAQRYAPRLKLHVSTQAGVSNHEAARAWHELGASRVILARELSLEEIREIRGRTPPSLEIEAFVHGAMCMSHSGRCLLSNFMVGRDANRGNCAQPCRWRYSLMEETRPGEYFPVEQTDTGTFIFNSKDLCMIDHVPDLCNAGIDSFKIEGRVKTEYYVSCVTQAYRRAIDYCFEDLDLYEQKIPDLYQEVCKVSHRQYYPGFYYGDQRQDSMNFTESSYIRDYELSAVVMGYEPLNKVLVAKQKNKFTVGDRLELVQANKEPVTFTVKQMFDQDGNEILAAPHAEMTVRIPYPDYVGSMSFLRRKKD